MKIFFENIIRIKRGAPLFALIILLGLSACKHGKQKTSDISSVSSFNELVELSSKVSKDSIRHIIRTRLLPAEALTPCDSVIVSYYSDGDDFLWLDMSEGIQRADTMLACLESSTEQGLDPEMFGTSGIREDMDKIHSLKIGEEESLNHLLADLEYRLTRAYLVYTCGMNYGFIQPGKILNNFEVDDSPSAKMDIENGVKKRKMKELYSIPLKRCDVESVRKTLADLQADFYAACKVQPTSAYYQKMKEELARLHSIEETDFEEIPTIGDSLLKVGDSHRIVPLIARRLKKTGELGEAFPDSSLVFTPELLDAVNLFREENRLSADESVGTFTIRYLNRPLGYYENCLRINMERARWQYLHEKGNKYVFVNVAAFMLQAVNEETDSILEMRICCGSAKNKTPLLSSKISYMEMNPYWNVPQNIVVREMIPAYRRDSAYFTKNRLKVYDKEGVRLNPHDIKWSKYTKGTPFTVKQDNKQGNSLGRIIFRFPNTFAVYLHDTPSRWTFTRSNRAVSHGCVRLEKALDFAFFLLPDHDETLQDRIRLSMDVPPVTSAGKKMLNNPNYKEMTNHNLKDRIPLYLDYQTVYLSKDGALSYCDDVYKYDTLLLEAFDKLSNRK
ncbi:L,D-transpeptidase family protein [Bacteroides sp.]